MLGSSQTDAQSLQAWMTFLNAYAHGNWLSPLESRNPPPIPTDMMVFSSSDGEIPNTGNVEDDPDVMSNTPDGTGTLQSESGANPSSEEIIYDFDNPVYSSVEITPAVASRVRAFYSRYRFLPPPRAPLEFLREQCIQEYDLYSDTQTQNIQAATDLVQAFFGGVVTFTLFKYSQQELVATAGDAGDIAAMGLYPGKRLLPETSMCGHTLLAKETVYVADLRLDWRHQGNPYAGGLKSYFGTVVSLSVDPTSAAEARVVPVGVINLMYVNEARPPLRPDQQKVLDHISRMLETHLRATWEGHKRTREERARRVISNFIEKALVQPAGAGFDHAAVPAPPPVTSNVLSSKSNPADVDEDNIVDSLAMHATSAMRQIRTVLDEVDTAAVIDVRSLRPIVRLNILNQRY